MFPRDRLEPVGLPDGNGMSAEAIARFSWCWVSLSQPKVEASQLGIWELRREVERAGRPFYLSANTCGPSWGSPLPSRWKVLGLQSPKRCGFCADSPGALPFRLSLQVGQVVPPQDSFLPHVRNLRELGAIRAW